jgi:hypothetical protein
VSQSQQHPQVKLSVSCSSYRCSKTAKSKTYQYHGIQNCKNFTDDANVRNSFDHILPLPEVALAYDYSSYEEECNEVDYVHDNEQQQASHEYEHEHGSTSTSSLHHNGSMTRSHPFCSQKHLYAVVGSSLPREGGEEDALSSLSPSIWNQKKNDGNGSTHTVIQHSFGHVSAPSGSSSGNNNNNKAGGTTTTYPRRSAGVRGGGGGGGGGGTGGRGSGSGGRYRCPKCGSFVSFRHEDFEENTFYCATCSGWFLVTSSTSTQGNDADGKRNDGSYTQELKTDGFQLRQQIAMGFVSMH